MDIFQVFAFPLDALDRILVQAATQQRYADGLFLLLLRTKKI